MESNGEIEKIEIIESGLQCDNPKCDWTDKTITFKNYKGWINKPCPVCGENVLTEEDYINAEKLRLITEYISSLSSEDLEELSESMGIKGVADLQNHPMFKNIKGVDTLKNEGEAIISISTHKQIKIDEIKNVEK